MPDLDVNENSDIYYQGRYWNDLEAVIRHLNQRVSGDPSTPWYEHFARATGRTFDRALILNCGNGWVERDLLACGLVREAVGIDYAEDLLREARAAAAEGGLALTYEQVNINTGELPHGEFDLVVNHAGAHHIAAIDRVFREICRLLPDDGWFVSHDYVGPHRNQYAPDAWEAAWTLNGQLPGTFRQDLRYPHLPTMLVMDPTEAIHSELIVETFRRYFTTREFIPLGGALAYPLLTHNDRLLDAEDEAARAQCIERVLDADVDFLNAHPDSTLFAYFAGTPDKSVLERGAQLSSWTAAEDERERVAADHGGEYYPRGALASALIALDEARREGERVAARTQALASEVEALRADPVYAAFRALLDAKATRRVRSTRLVGAAERRTRAAVGRRGPAESPASARDG
ncbi:MAG TPA: class I SAM-dependent methyltransferase [Acidimicrobiales bacterium]|jgi:SAM-dependent methyltransferase|nr:class I SAM-dependent methyltransferase [Acidimicrobiales bacterium]